jgi:putative SOS response-associated peptidase YedK
MCYSAQIAADYKKYTRLLGAKLSIHEFFELFWLRNSSAGASVTVPKGVSAAFADAVGEQELSVKHLIDQFAAAETNRLREEISKQAARLEEAQARLLVKETKAAADSKRIATRKIQRGREKIDALQRTELTDEDSRVYPGNYVPLMVMEHGERVVKPMRYQCRPAGKPEYYDVQYPGTYNARRDSLRGFWKGQFGHTHGILVLDAFYENVPLHRWERRRLADGEKPRNVVVQFKPKTGEEMLVACVWSHWVSPGKRDLLSFAIITDDPPPEISEAGHDRCPIAIQSAHVDAWLNPDPNNLGAMDSILGNRQTRLFYEARLAPAAALSQQEGSR